MDVHLLRLLWPSCTKYPGKIFNLKATKNLLSMKLKNLCLICLALLLFSCRESHYPYQNTNLDFETRASDLVSRMTLEEKVSQMTHYADAVERLGIPEYNWWNECLHGVARSGKATVFPQAIGMAATFDRDIMFRMADVTSTEARAKYNDYFSRGLHGIYQGLTFWSPNINIFRDPRWGRGHETYGEDPYLTGEMAVQFIKGLQGDDPRYLKTVATSKHYIVHSGPEPLRHEFNAVVSQRGKGTGLFGHVRL
jgi:beta-glucosidase